MNFWVLSAFPEILDSFLKGSLIGKAIEKEILNIHRVHLRNYGIGASKRIDDRPYGGGTGMIMRPEPVVEALREIPEKNARKILFSPRGSRLNQQKCKELAQEENLVLVCPRYEGIDERVSRFVDEEISLGDFILMGGEVAAMGLIESVGRLVPGVLGDPAAIQEESFETGLLESSQYTRPYDFEGMFPPEDLISGNHRAIAEWKEKNSREITKERRKDLFQNYIHSSSKES